LRRYGPIHSGLVEYGIEVRASNPSAQNAKGWGRPSLDLCQQESNNGKKPGYPPPAVSELCQSLRTFDLA
jgi:hypothetical protein